MIERIKAENIFSEIEPILEIQDIEVRITGSSMWPFFKDGKTKVRLGKIKNIKKGKVYLFRNDINDSYVLHRLVKINGETLIFRGDGNYATEKVSKEKLIAELVAFKNKQEVFVTNKFYRFKVFIYLLMPRRVMLKLFKRKV